MIDQYVKVETPFKNGMVRVAVYRYNSKRNSYTIYDVYEGPDSVSASLWLFDNSYENAPFHDDDGPLASKGLSTTEMIDFCNNMLNNKFK